MRTLFLVIFGISVLHLTQGAGLYTITDLGPSFPIESTMQAQYLAAIPAAPSATRTVKNSICPTQPEGLFSPKRSMMRE